MKGLILAAGEGTRLAELNLKHKSFAIVNKKHIIDYSLDLLRNEDGRTDGRKTSRFRDRDRSGT